MAAYLTNVTNDPSTVHLRVFIGNLNTFKVSRDDVANIFGRHGQLTGISMHKGFGFVQYALEWEARHAVAMEDGRVYSGQQIDVTMAAEPKYPGHKRAAPNEWNADWSGDWNNSYYDQGAAAPPSSVRTLVHLGGGPPPTKKYAKDHAAPVAYQGKTPCQDIIICGTCKDTFSSINQLVDHKNKGCRLKFSCQCTNKSDEEPNTFNCGTCKREFTSCWELCKHAQVSHNMAIYDVPTPTPSVKSDAGADEPSSAVSEQPLVSQSEMESSIIKALESEDVVSGNALQGTTDPNGH